MDLSQFINLAEHKLPEDVLFHILFLLPVKSICRFRCVSKRWKSLLSHPQFIKTHLNRTKQLLGGEEASLIFVSNEFGLSGCLYSAPFKYAHHPFDEITTLATKLCFGSHCFTSSQVINMVSCDGLVLFMDEQNKFVLINPATREIKELPTSPYALNPRVSDINYGLGYDSIKDDYKVVTISYYRNFYRFTQGGSSEMFVNAYSVRNGTWERAESSPYDHDVGYVLSPGCFVDGRIHWLAVRFSDDSSVIATLDLGEGKFGQVPSPGWVGGRRETKFDQVMELGGCLCWYPFRSLDSGKTAVFMMKDYGVMDSWTKFNIVYSEPFTLRPLCLLGNKQLVLMHHEGYYEERLVMYNSEDRSIKDIVVHGIAGNEFFAGGSFMESLVSPHCTTEVVAEF